jgi:MYXO-CTERM domain-containing protein
MGPRVLPSAVLLTLGLAHARPALGEDLVIVGQSGMTIEGMSFDKLVIEDSQDITIRNCTFAAADGAVASIEGSTNVLVEDCDIDGLVDACTGLDMSGNAMVTIRGNTIHDIADDGIQVGASTEMRFERNTIAHLYGVGTDSGGPCYNGHSDGFEVYDVEDSVFVGNLVFDVRSTSAFFMGNWDDAAPCRNLTLANNVFYTPDSGFVIYVHYVEGMKLYNNTFWQGVYGGLAVGPSVTGLDVFNNILHSVNYAHSGESPDAAEHRFDYNLLADDGQGYPGGAGHDVIAGDPVFAGVPAIGGAPVDEIAPEMFALADGSPAIDVGMADGDVPETDLFGNARADHPDVANGGAGSIDYTDLGAIEAMGMPPAGDESGGDDDTATDDGAADSGGETNDGADAATMNDDDAADTGDDAASDDAATDSDGSDSDGAAEEGSGGCGCTSGSDRTTPLAVFGLLLLLPRRRGRESSIIRHR